MLSCILNDVPSGYLLPTPASLQMPLFSNVPCYYIYLKMPSPLFVLQQTLDCKGKLVTRHIRGESFPSSVLASFRTSQSFTYECKFWKFLAVLDHGEFGHHSSLLMLAIIAQLWFGLIKQFVLHKANRINTLCRNVGSLVEWIFQVCLPHKVRECGSFQRTRHKHIFVKSKIFLPKRQHLLRQLLSRLLSPFHTLSSSHFLSFNS